MPVLRARPAVAQTTEGGKIVAWKDTMSKSMKKVSDGASKAYDVSKNKAEQMQIEMKMDGLAKKLGYMAFDAHRGREVDEEARIKLLADFEELEAGLDKLKADAAARAEAAKAAKEEEAAAEEETPAE